MTGIGWHDLCLNGLTEMLTASLTRARIVNWIGIDFQHGARNRPQLVANDPAIAPTLPARGACRPNAVSFATPVYEQRGGRL